MEIYLKQVHSFINENVLWNSEAYGVHNTLYLHFKW